MSILWGNSDIEALVKGYANVNILVRGKTFVFNHTDSIFKIRRPLEPDQFSESDKWTLCETTFKFNKEKAKYKWKNCHLWGEPFWKSCWSSKNVQNLQTRSLSIICKVCEAKKIVRKRLMNKIDKIELFDEELRNFFKFNNL